MTHISHELWLESAIGRDLSDGEARELFLVSRRETFQPGDVLFREGDEPSALYLIVEGAIDVEKATEAGAVQIAGLGRGAIVGEMSLLAREPRTASARVKDGPVTVLRVDWKDLEQLMNENRGAAYKLVYALARLLAHRLKNINAKVAELSARTTDGAADDKLAELSRFKARLFQDWSF